MKVLIKKQIFGNYDEYELDENFNLVQILEHYDVPKHVWPYVQIRIRGELVEQRYWQLVKPKRDISLAVIPAGGEETNILKTVVIIAAAYYAPGLLPVGAPGFLGALTSAGAALVTSSLLNQMFPPPNPFTATDDDRTTLPAITGQSNQADPYGVVIRNYGFNRVYPRVAAEPYTYFIGEDQYFVGLYDFGIGPQELNPSSLKIGESDLFDFDNITYNIANLPSEFTIYKKQVNIEEFSLPFENVGDSYTRNSPPAVSALNLDFAFPNGLLVRQGSKQKANPLKIDLVVRIKKTSQNNWNAISDFKYNVDTKYEVTNKVKYKSLIKFDNFTITKSVNIVSLGVNITLDYYSSSINSSIIEFTPYPLNTSLSDAQNNNFITPLEIPAVGDILDYTFTSATGITFPFREATITEIISTSVVNGRIFYKVRLDTLFRTSRTGISVSSYPFNGYLSSNTERRFNTISIERNTTKPFRFSIQVELDDEDDYEVRVDYLNRSSVFPSSSRDTFIDDFFWVNIKGFSDNNPVLTNIPHTYLELRVKATDQLSGAIKNLSGEVFSELEVYNELTQSYFVKTSNNPAWVFVDILTGTINQRAISKDKIDIDSILKWAKYCDSNRITYSNFTVGFEANFVVDFKITIKELLNKVCSIGRASLQVINGKYGVIIDELKTVPTQVFTQRNIKGISINREYTKVPDAIACIFTDPQSNWQKNQVIAYDDGKNASNSTIIEEIEIFGATEIAQAWRQGRYFLAQHKLRRTQITINVDFEGLACNRGDLVLVAHDVLKQGGLPIRVLNVNNDILTLDENVSDGGQNYILRSRLRATNEIVDLEINQFLDVNQVQVLDPKEIQIDDLVVFGESETVTREYIVKSIEYTDDFDANINLLEYAPEVYNADSGTIPNYTVITQSSALAGGIYPNAVENLEIDYIVNCHRSEKRYVYNVELQWDAPTGSIVDVYEIYVEIQGQQQLAGFTKNKIFTFEISGLNLGLEHSFRVVGVDGSGRKMPIQNASQVSIIPEDDTEAPQDILEFNANLLTETCELSWKQPVDCDIDKFVIRFSPNYTGASWATSTKLTTCSANQLSVQVPIRTGTYFIKAFDYAGNQSVNAVSLKTQIPEVLKVDFITEIKLPVWDGVFLETETIGNNLKLKSTDDNETFTNAFGSFVFKEVFDLGDVFTARFTSAIEASGFTKSSLMSNWNTLAEIDPIAGNFTDDDFDVGTYVRVRNDADTMADWQPLASVDYLSFGSEANSTPWQRFTNADFTGRLFQLKLELEGNEDQTISPLVYNANVVANWTERIEEGKDYFSGQQVVFDFEFNETPAIQVTAIQDGQPGDTSVITNKNKAGFFVQVYDVNLNPVNDRTFDWIAKGFGKKYTLEDINF